MRKVVVYQWRGHSCPRFIVPHGGFFNTPEGGNPLFPLTLQVDPRFRGGDIFRYGPLVRFFNTPFRPVPLLPHHLHAHLPGSRPVVEFEEHDLLPGAERGLPPCHGRCE